MKFDLLLYAVTDRSWTGALTLAEQLEEALKAGVTLVQLREKDMAEDLFLAEARQIRTLTSRYQVPLIINDNVSVALACDADGVHVGQEDLAVDQVRELLGPDKILGVTVKTVAQALHAEALGADYLGSGAMFGSTTKTGARPMTTEQLRKITAAVSIPVVAIGGINRDNILKLRGTGAAGAAIVSGIFAAADITEAVQTLRRQMEGIRTNGKK